MTAEKNAYHVAVPGKLRFFLPVSQGTKNELLECYPNAAADLASSNIAVVPNGADLDVFSPRNRSLYRSRIRDELGFRDNDFVCIFSGGDWKRKGLDIALKALSTIDAADVKLLVVGHDRCGAPVRDLCNELGISDRTVFAGFCRHVEEYYAAADLFVFPTSYEAFSVATIEAAASGLPILMSDVSGAEELVGDKIAGEIVARDAEAYAAAILKYRSSPELRAKVGIAARGRVEDEFSWDSVAVKTLAIYQKLIDSK